MDKITNSTEATLIPESNGQDIENEKHEENEPKLNHRISSQVNVARAMAIEDCIIRGEEISSENVARNLEGLMSP